MRQYKTTNLVRYVKEFRSHFGYDTAALLESMDYDTLWKAFCEYNTPAIIQYFLPEKSKQLDLSKAIFINKEQQELIKQKLGKVKDQKYVDKLIQIPYQNDPDRYLRLHLEFQTIAGPFFAEKMADYMTLIVVDNKEELYTFAIISRAQKSYRNKYVVGTEENGITFRFTDHIINKQKEIVYDNPTCLVSQILHAIWIKENKRFFDQDELEKKYLTLADNIISIGLDDIKYVSALLFIQKYAQKCLSGRKRFNIFAEKVFNKNPKLEIMHIFDKMKAEGIKEGKAEGIAEGKAKGKEEEKIEIIKKMAGDSKFSVQEIARIVSASVKQVKAIIAVL